MYLPVYEVYLLTNFCLFFSLDYLLSQGSQVRTQKDRGRIISLLHHQLYLNPKILKFYSVWNSEEYEETHMAESNFFNCTNTVLSSIKKQNWSETPLCF